MMIDKDRAEIARLTGLLCEGIIAPDELARLEARLLDNPEAQRLYHHLVALRDCRASALRGVPARRGR